MINPKDVEKKEGVLNPVIGPILDAIDEWANPKKPASPPASEGVAPKKPDGRNVSEPSRQPAPAETHEQKVAKFRERLKQNVRPEEFHAAMEEFKGQLTKIGREDLFDDGLVKTGVESKFGAEKYALRKQTFFGMSQIGKPELRTLQRWAESNKEKLGGVNPLAGDYTVKPYDGIILAVATIRNESWAADATGKKAGELSAAEVYAPHLFGVSGGYAFLKALTENPDTKLKDVRFRTDDSAKSYIAVRPQAFKANFKNNLNPDKYTYENITVGQTMQLLQRKFDAAAQQVPAEYYEQCMAAIDWNRNTADESAKPGKESIFAMSEEQLARIKLAADLERGAGRKGSGNPNSTTSEDAPSKPASTKESPAPAPTPSEKDVAAAKITIPNAGLKRGAKGEQVLAMQQALVKLGYMDEDPNAKKPVENQPVTGSPVSPWRAAEVQDIMPGLIGSHMSPIAPKRTLEGEKPLNLADKKFGIATERALKSFQDSNGLIANGVYDAATREKFAQQLGVEFALNTPTDTRASARAPKLQYPVVPSNLAPLSREPLSSKPETSAPYSGNGKRSQTVPHHGNMASLVNEERGMLRAAEVSGGEAANPDTIRATSQRSDESRNRNNEIV